VRAPDLHALLLHEDDRLRMSLEGRAETNERTLLNQFLSTTDQHAQRLKIKEVEIDLRALKFMNSSCFKEFVVWVSNVKGHPKEGQYRMRFIASKKIRWQYASLHSLSCFAIDLIQIDSP
jgi:hypothetical protein